VKFAATRHVGLATIIDFVSTDGHTKARTEHEADRQVAGTSVRRGSGPRARERMIG